MGETQERQEMLLRNEVRGKLIKNKNYFNIKMKIGISYANLLRCKLLH